MKILTVVGARPQFIKAAAVSRVLGRSFTEVLVHTGQHYDANMSDIFFEELSIPHPDYNMGIGGGSHGKQTGEMLIKIEETIQAEKPDIVLTYGDTNSTLAGSLAASKLLIPVAHVEAGLRSFNMAMPEEQNRILTDRVSNWLFCPTQTAVTNLNNEGIINGIYNVGDVMYDALLYYKDTASARYRATWRDEITCITNDIKDVSQWYLMTIHRQENTDDNVKLETVLSAAEALDAPVLFPLHPRIRARAEQMVKNKRLHNVRLIEPVGYMLMLYLTANAKKVLTDSGGLQKEAWMLGTPCVTIREQTEWVETLEGGWNVLAHVDKADIINKTALPAPISALRGTPFGDGHAAEKIRDILEL